MGIKCNTGQMPIALYLAQRKLSVSVSYYWHFCSFRANCQLLFEIQEVGEDGEDEFWRKRVLKATVKYHHTCLRRSTNKGDSRLPKQTLFLLLSECPRLSASEYIYIPWKMLLKVCGIVPKKLESQRQQEKIHPWKFMKSVCGWQCSFQTKFVHI